jgi:hypothetical protein
MIRSFLHLLILVPALCAAQSDAPVERPALKPGDRWAYNRMDYWTNRVTTVRNIEVTSANDKVIQVVATEPGRPEMDETYTAEWNSVATSLANSTPHSGHLRFPLKIGESHPWKFETIFGPQRNWRSEHERVTRVVGWEEITVPAGKFRALKVVQEGDFRRLDVSVAGKTRTTTWYAPEVKRWVKFLYEDEILTGFQRGPFNKFGEELVSFKVQ